MRGARNLFYNNRNVIFLNLAIVAAFWLLGYIVYDIVAAFDPAESAEPTGALAAYIGLFIAFLCCSMPQGYSMFHLQVSMGQTRKGFFLEQLLVRTGLLLAVQLMIYGLYQLELWRFRIFYPTKELGHLVYDLELLFAPSRVFLITLIGLAISLLLIALALRFGVKANFAMLVLYLLFVFLINRTEAIMEYLNVHFVGADFVKAAFAALAAVGVVCLAAAWGLLRRHEVK